MMKLKVNNKHFTINVAVLLISAVLYFSGLLSVFSVFIKTFSFPFPDCSRFLLSREINLIVGIIAFISSQVFYLFFYEKNRETLNLEGKTILFYSLIGPLSSAVVLKNKKAILHHGLDSPFLLKNSRPISMVDKVGGVLISLGAMFLLISFIVKIISFESYPYEYTSSQMSHNERKAYRRLLQIYDAQQEYIKTDWDKDGTYSYSLFLVNLWQTLDEDVFPIEISLISKELGYAMRRAHSLDGYFYVNIHTRSLGQDPDNSYNTLKARLDCRNEFAIAAFPERYGETGRLSFILDQTGAMKSVEILKIRDDSLIGLFLLPAPVDFEKWRQLLSEEELIEFQSNMFTDKD